jgi:putative hydrolase
MLGSQGPVNWDVAQQVANWVATEGASEPNVDPLERIRLEELLRVAELHVGEATGLATSATGRALGVVAVTRTEWANRTLDAYRSLLEHLAVSLATEDDDPAAPAPDDATAQFFGNLGELMAPLLLGMQAGFMVGHLAHRTLGQYDLPIPRPASDELLVVPANLDHFASEWSLPADDLRLWVCLREVAHHAVLSLPHVRDRLQSLLTDYVSGFDVDPSLLDRQLADLDPTDPQGFQITLGDPENLLGAIQTPAQAEVLVRLQAATAPLEGWVDHVMDAIGARLIGSYPQLTEALRRHRVTAGPADRFVERLLGLHLDQAQYDRGAAFVRGVLERSGPDALARLWAGERELPTPAELDAPGLWLARIDLPDDPADQP